MCVEQTARRVWETPNARTGSAAAGADRQASNCPDDGSRDGASGASRLLLHLARARDRSRADLPLGSSYRQSPSYLCVPRVRHYDGHGAIQQKRPSRLDPQSRCHGEQLSLNLHRRHLRAAADKPGRWRAPFAAAKYGGKTKTGKDPGARVRLERRVGGPRPARGPSRTARKRNYAPRETAARPGRAVCCERWTRCAGGEAASASARAEPVRGKGWSHVDEAVNLQ